MKVSKRERVLLFVVLLLVIGAVYYLFFFSKHQPELEALETKLEESESKNDDIQLKLMQGSNLDEQISSSYDSVVSLAKRNYGLLIQENQVLLIQKMAAGTGLKINSIQFEIEVLPISEMHQNLVKYRTEQLEILKKSMVPNLEKSLQQGGLGTDMPSGISEDFQEGADEFRNDDSEGTEEESAEEAYDSSYVDELKAEISFEGSYEDIDKFLENIYAHDKEIIVEAIQFKSELISKKNVKKEGTIVLDFYGVRELASFIEADEDIFSSFTTRGEGEAYRPYSTFVIKTNKTDVDKTKVTYTPPVKPPKPVEPPKPVVPAGPVVVAKRLQGFEDTDVFFVTNDEESKGSVQRVNKAKFGTYAAQMNYDFASREHRNEANIVFDKAKVMVYSGAENILLHVNTIKPFGENKLGLCLIDATGKEHLAYFDIKPEAVGWMEARTQVPEGIDYPFMIQRIFVEGVGQDQLLNSTIIVDELSYEFTKNKK